MKTIQKLPIMEARTVVVLVALTIGLGIAVHEIFFVIALGIVLVEAVEWTVQKICEYLHDFRLFYRYP